MQEKENAEIVFPRKNFEAVCYHSLGVLEQNREYLVQHLGPERMDERVERSLADIQTACARLDRSLTEMMALLACLHGEAQPKLRTFDLGTLVQELTTQQGPIKEQLGITLLVDVPERESGFAVCADKDWAEQICLHLVSNALHACDRGGQVCLALRQEQEKILLTVSDDGCGLPGTSPESQLNNRRHFVGSAQAGLLLCREYCRMMGWQLELRGQQRGAQAVVTIPPVTAGLPHARAELHEENDEERRLMRLGRLLAGEVAEIKQAETGEKKQ